ACLAAQTFIAFAEGPLDAARGLNPVIGHAADVEGALGASREFLHLFENRLGLFREADALSVGKTFCHLVEDPEVRLRIRVGRHGVARQVHAPLAVGVAALFLRPDRGREVDVCVLVAFGVLVAVLHYEELEFFHDLADTSRVGHRGHRVGGDNPQAPDLAGFYGGDNVRLYQAARSGEEVRFDAPERDELAPVLLVLKVAVTRQARAGGPLARAHGVALAGDGQRSAARFADVAGDQVEVV